jgi:hypothetical protein
MTESSNFQPGENLPTLGVTDRSVGALSRWALPIATGMAAALIVLAII